MNLKPINYYLNNCMLYELPEINIAEPTISQARKSIQRMLDISAAAGL